MLWKKTSFILLSPISSLVLESGLLLSYMNTCASTAEVGASDHGQEEDGAILVAVLV